MLKQVNGYEAITRLMEKGKIVISYSNIEEKNILESDVSKLSPHESLIHCLNVIDFMAAFSPVHYTETPDQVEWIILEVKTLHNDK